MRSERVWDGHKDGGKGRETEREDVGDFFGGVGEIFPELIRLARRLLVLDL